MKKSILLFLFIVSFLYPQEKENKDTHMDSLFGVINPAPKRTEGEGPFKRLIIRGAILIDGTGAPPRGPVDIVVEGNKITRVASVGTPFIEINDGLFCGTLGRSRPMAARLRGCWRKPYSPSLYGR